MDIPPETKDWTWVLAERCGECGFDCGGPERGELPALARQVDERWTSAFAAVPDPSVRPSPLVWSPVEYACHVRDVLALARYRTRLMLDEDDPVFANWDQDATAVEDDYGSQDPQDVRAALHQNAAGYAADLASLSAEEWDRPGRRSDDKSFTVDSFARYLLHDPIHHLTDITGQPWA
jgi:hypothetical protein